MIPENTSVIIFTPFFHRDNQRLAFADQFTPELWDDDRTAQSAGLVPFSDGPAICPGRHLVLLLSSAMLAAILEFGPIRLASRRNLVPGNMPATLNHFGLRFEIRY